MTEGARTHRFSPGELSPRSGVYRIFHAAHRPVHEAAMLAGERFPRCRVCGDAVRFELAATTKGSAATEGQNPSVLIASHESSAMGRLRSLLSEMGYSVSLAADAAAVREQLEQTHCDAVITPLDLGQSRSGLEIARLAKQLNPKPLVFIYTSAPTTEAMREILRTRVDYCALEPLNVSEVSSALETLMARRLQ
jgi:CheY-like chemotaxis protein